MALTVPIVCAAPIAGIESVGCVLPIGYNTGPAAIIALWYLPIAGLRPELLIIIPLPPEATARSCGLARLCIALWLSLGFGASAWAEEISREYRIKAAYLYNLSKFITWPDEDQLGKDVPITLCVYGYNPFDTYLDKLREHPVRGRTIAIRFVAENQSTAGCQLLFVSQHNATAPKLLSAPPPYPAVLTVSDDQDFLMRGGMVALITVNNNVQLDINLTRAKQAGFVFSANLLEVAHRIQ